ncbi:unnamed protein product [Sphagnum troendelagicum]|uniref:GLTSCR protein conserved domain-containing protein n=1 Tax=Sphagnum troendelagicum TaxID=128251 RepID=A0ABP0U0S6_9BRYO
MATPQQPQQQTTQLPAKPKMKDKKPTVASYPAKPHKTGAAADSKFPDKLEVELARQDVLRVCNPDFKRPFSSVEDACERLLPYHIVAEYEPDDMEVSTSESGVPVSRSQAWKESLESKSSDFMRMLDKQINTFNSIMRRRAEGDMRGEERLLVEKWLLVDERQKLADARAQIEAKEKAEREAQEARVKEALAQAERARAEALARAEAQAQAEAARAQATAQAEAAQQDDAEQQTNQVSNLQQVINLNQLQQPQRGGDGVENLEDWESSEAEEDDVAQGGDDKEEEDDEEGDNDSEGFFMDDEGGREMLVENGPDGGR